jgi:hypothetical protein
MSVNAVLKQYCRGPDGGGEELGVRSPRREEVCLLRLSSVILQDKDTGVEQNHEINRLSAQSKEMDIRLSAGFLNVKVSSQFSLSL